MTNDSPAGEAVVVEPLAESAALQLQLAEQLCGESCRWYHGPRLYLRALGVIHGVRLDTPFLLDALGQVALQTEHAHVLVSGAADYGMLAHVTTAWAEAGRALTVTVVDTCLTPLRMNLWFGERVAVPVHVHHGDILDHPAGESFDLICTHGFLGRFDAQERRRIVEKWHGLLKPSGAVVTAHRLRTMTPDGQIPFVERRKRRIRDRVRRALAHPARIADATPEMMTVWTSEFVRRRVMYPLFSIDEIRSVFASVGFSVSVSQHRGSCAATEPLGTPSDDGAWRLGVVATKPA